MGDGLSCADSNNYHIIFQNKYQSYTVYGEINASFISLRVGYNFNGQLTYDDDVKKALYKGLTASVQAMYMF